MTEDQRESEVIQIEAWLTADQLNSARQNETVQVQFADEAGSVIVTVPGSVHTAIPTGESLLIKSDTIPVRITVQRSALQQAYAQADEGDRSPGENRSMFFSKAGVCLGKLIDPLLDNREEKADQIVRSDPQAQS